MNKVILVGRMANSPYKGITASNVEYSRFTIVVKRPYITPNNEPILDFVPCVAWRANAQFVNKYHDKGSLLLIEGSFQSSKITSPDGQISNSYVISVDRVESLESKEAAEARKKNSLTREFTIPADPKFSKEDNHSPAEAQEDAFDQLDWDF
ncbi:single-stranded DNA-binding protein [Mycoplasma phocoeninasale]|uniref:Single-stranded DNA-binding protein n=1 Tax=Mycoplasma phocoeninasale TaxID=2726117 RepID=A0A858U0H7_9MOLU|nr:single-stranded DNA-binding protein [Mycoplasma phocoeninasale]MBN0970913.1 single-stranded DNA-binding protein [Mycoplasma phocoeninasale]QJG66574.1 single-stranded DNA-binding protein [Mycoplasma phocoeninasale]